MLQLPNLMIIKILYINTYYIHYVVEAILS